MMAYSISSVQFRILRGCDLSALAELRGYTTHFASTKWGFGGGPHS